MSSGQNCQYPSSTVYVDTEWTGVD